MKQLSVEMYKDYNDYELLELVHANNEEARSIVYKKYEPLIVSYSKKMLPYCKNAGLEVNDLVQEGMLGLTNAINTFKEDKNILFYTYAKTCIERKIISSSIKANRFKHKPLNDSLSFDQEVVDGSIHLGDFFGNDNINPEKLVINEEQYVELVEELNKVLTEFESQVFSLKTNGFDYKEIASILDRNSKAIDNALQRIKSKLKKILNK